SFNDCVVALTPVIIVVMAAQLIATHLIWGRDMRATSEARARVMALDERGMITDLPLMRTSLFVIGGGIAAFVAAWPLGLQPGTSALFGAALLMLFHHFGHHRAVSQQP